MFKKYGWLALALFLSFSELGAKIIEVWDLETLWEKRFELTEEDLVIFDVDHTLILEKDMILRPCRRRCLNHLLHLRGETDPKRREYLISQVALERKIQLVDPHSPTLIKQLQAQGVKVMALTAMKCGPLGQIDKTEVWRAQELQELGLDFRSCFPNLKTLVLEELPHPTSPPTYEQGVLCASYYTKGKALCTFLKKMDFRPRQIIFVDNRYAYLKSAETELKKMDIPFTGLYYRAWVTLPGKQNENVADFQIRYLIKHEKWLSDEEAKAKIGL